MGGQAGQDGGDGRERLSREHALDRLRIAGGQELQGEGGREQDEAREEEAEARGPAQG